MRSETALRAERPTVGPRFLEPPARASSRWEQNELAPSSKSYSELQRQFIGAELGRREADGRKDALAELQIALDDVAVAPPSLKVLPTQR